MKKNKHTQRSFLPGLLILEPSGTTDPTRVHGPSNDADRAYLILSPVEKRKYTPSLARRIRPGSRTCASPVEPLGGAYPATRAVNSDKAAYEKCIFSKHRQTHTQDQTQANGNGRDERRRRREGLGGKKEKDVKAVSFVFCLPQEWGLYLSSGRCLASLPSRPHHSHTQPVTFPGHPKSIRGRQYPFAKKLPRALTERSGMWLFTGIDHIPSHPSQGTDSQT